MRDSPPELPSPRSRVQGGPLHARGEGGSAVCKGGQSESGILSSFLLSLSFSFLLRRFSPFSLLHFLLPQSSFYPPILLVLPTISPFSLSFLPSLPYIPSAFLILLLLLSFSFFLHYHPLTLTLPLNLLLYLSSLTLSSITAPPCLNSSHLPFSYSFLLLSFLSSCFLLLPFHYLFSSTFPSSFTLSFVPLFPLFLFISSPFPSSFPILSPFFLFLLPSSSLIPFPPFLSFFFPLSSHNFSPSPFSLLSNPHPLSLSFYCILSLPSLLFFIPSPLLSPLPPFPSFLLLLLSLPFFSSLLSPLPSLPPPLLLPFPFPFFPLLLHLLLTSSFIPPFPSFTLLLHPSLYPQRLSLLSFLLPLPSFSLPFSSPLLLPSLPFLHPLLLSLPSLPSLLLPFLPPSLPSFPLLLHPLFTPAFIPPFLPPPFPSPLLLPSLPFPSLPSSPPSFLPPSLPLLLPSFTFSLPSPFLLPSSSPPFPSLAPLLLHPLFTPAFIPSPAFPCDSVFLRCSRQFQLYR
ncbi:hypothetical protein C7M84_022616 [Penaeus vannamei]|uniref:Uncharacterized protein n=1 Tax=Penaeus vannamei TaxID=6689 RepID=A0A423U657_PENVA|nr:hypothetical protein C7M84_022616 [Penaeus vannamei]